VTPLVSARSLRYVAGGRPVLEGVDLDLHAGERLGLTGATGSGKTTLLHLLVGLLAPAGGSIRAFGAERRTEADFRGVRPRLGLLFQDPDDQLFAPTVAEDVAFGPLNLGCSRAEAEGLAGEALARVGLTGYGDRVTWQLSGGEKRLVSLAGVLAMGPEALLLDEPTTGLDPQATGRLLEELARLPQAMVLVSHDPAVLDRLATRRLHLADGRLHPG
jgi:cobalt/nickel transport system ATP-binding protein